MKKISLISVIVLTYNQEDTIARTLDSILCQQCHLLIEIVIGEDCSTDHTRKICQQYAQEHPDQIRLFCNEQNKGIITNYFDCLLACRGELIADCAGDDFWVDNQKLEKASRLMEADDSITIVHTAWCKYYEQTKTIETAPTTPFTAPLTDGKEMLEAILTQTNIPVVHLCTSLYRAETIRNAYYQHSKYFKDTDWGCEDLQTVFFLAKEGRVAYLPDITLYYSQGDHNFSAPKDEKKLFNFYKNVTHLSYCLSKEYGIETSRTKTFFSHRAYALLMHAFRACDKPLRQEALAYQKKWEAQRSLSFLIIQLLTTNNISWKGLLMVRSLFVRMKQALR